jgi:hypothetical protein
LIVFVDLEVLGLLAVVTVLLIVAVEEILQISLYVVGSR